MDDVEDQDVVSIRADADDAGHRLDKVLARHAEILSLALSRTRLRAFVEGGVVRVDGITVLDPSSRTKPGVLIEFATPPIESAVPEPEAIPLAIVFEDEHLLVIEKPAGLVVHPAAGHATGTLVNALLAHCGAGLSGVGGVRRPGIVHRLDKDTSGLLVAAKGDRAHQGLSALFADHGRTGSLVRDYLAFVWNRPDQRVGTVDAPLGRHPTQREKMAVVVPDKGRHAVTRWTLEAGFGSLAARLRCRLETGRTHQIRVHMADIGHPLIGDAVYGGGFRTKALRLDPAARESVNRLGRQALHAAVLGFDHPVTGETLRFESALPPDLARLEQALRTGAGP